VLIDAENIHPSLTGTFEGSVSLVRALDSHGDIRQVVWTTSAGRQAEVEEAFKELDLTKSIFVESGRVHTLKNIDIAFRPYQDFSGDHWPKLAAIAHRNIIWILDLIATHIVHYSADYLAFTRLRDSMETAIERADGIGVLTAHVRRDLESFTSCQVSEKVFQLPNGVPGISPARITDQSHQKDLDQGSQIDSILGSEFVLVLGTNFWHKNWTWFIQLMQVVSDLGWRGQVVFAGPTPNRATSALRDLEVTESWDPRRVTFLGRVSNQNRLRLLSGARLVVSPTTSEGWGMIPCEAIAMGSVPLATRGGGLCNITPDAAAFLSLADDRLDALTVHGLLTDDTMRATQVEAWRDVGLPTWPDVADILVHHMFTSISRPRAWRPSKEPRWSKGSNPNRRLRMIVETVSPKGTLRRRVVTFIAQTLRRLR
jgi:hypothetical protein